MEELEKIKYLVEFLNKCCDEYYNNNNPSISDAEYDRLFDELSELEMRTGIILPNSPTVRPGYEVVGELRKISHDIPLLSLAKTKIPGEVYNMASTADGYLALKLDGLTVKITYVDGEIVEAATRGDGAVGEDVTHNARVFSNVPRKISEKNRMVISGEAFIDIPTFERINNAIDEDEKKYSTPRNLASGSVRQLDSKICAERGISFLPFNVLEGMDNIKSKTKRLERLGEMGFGVNPFVILTRADTVQSTEDKIYALKKEADKLGFPIDGIVFSFDDVDFCRAQGKTSHHFKDGIAFKFGDPTAISTLNDIIWNISRTGQLTPIAEFSPVEIDNTTVERASLHNMTFVEELKLLSGDELLVSKRNMIIPHIEKNMTADSEDRNGYVLNYPLKCPVCGGPTCVRITGEDDSTVKVLYCENSYCPGKKIKKYTHFVSKPAMNIEGLSEATLEKFLKLGWLNSLADIFSLPSYREEIVSMEGFGDKSYENLCESIQNARKTTLSNLLVAVNISLVGKNASKDIEQLFSGSAEKFLQAIEGNYDFSRVEGFGEAINTEIHKWFSNDENKREFLRLIDILELQEYSDQKIDKDNPFFEKTVVITGTFENFSRDELTEILKARGAKVTGSVSKNTDMVLCGQNAGSKLQKANSLGVEVIGEQELKKML